MLFTAVKNKVTEADPTTTNWEESKGQLAQGKIGTMWLGSWAIPQMQDAAKTAGASLDSIGYAVPGSAERQVLLRTRR